MKRPKIPQYLKNDGRRFFKRVLSEFQLEDSHDIERLALAAEALDKIAEARAQIEKDGPYFRDRWNQLKSHPAEAVQRNQATLFARLIREAGLDLEQPGETRPPRQY